MILNELLTKQSILNAVRIKTGERELNDALKVKITRLLIAYNKVKKQFDNDVQEFTKNLIPEDLRFLQDIPEEKLTKENLLQIEELNKDINLKYNKFFTEKGLESVNADIKDSFTEEEFDEIIKLNATEDVVINKEVLKSTEFLEAFYELFVTSL